jgi:hypothetical protein
LGSSYIFLFDTVTRMFLFRNNSQKMDWYIINLKNRLV